MSNEPKHTATPIETIEEAANVFYNESRLRNPKSFFIEGAKWQSEQTQSELESLRAVNAELNALADKNDIEIEKLQSVQTDLVFENQVYRGKVEELESERAELIEALRWNSVEDKLPKPLQTVWLSNGKSWAALGCLVESDGGWHWAESNGVTYLENGEIVSECESDDLDVKFWIALPKPPQP